MKSNSKKFDKNNLKTKNRYLTLAIHSKKISNDLVKLGVIDNKTKTISFPVFLKKYLYRDFIRGIFDSDGCFTFCKQTNRNDYVGRFSISGTKKLCETIQQIFLTKLNIPLTKLAKDNRCYSNFRTLGISRLSDLVKIYKFLYSDSKIHLNRKKHKFEEYFSIRKAKL